MSMLEEAGPESNSQVISCDAGEEGGQRILGSGDLAALLWGLLDRVSRHRLRQVCRQVRDCPALNALITTLTLKGPNEEDLLQQLLAWPRTATLRHLRVGGTWVPSLGAYGYAYWEPTPEVLCVPDLLTAALGDPRAQEVLGGIQTLWLQTLGGLGREAGPSLQLGQLCPQLREVVIHKHLLQSEQDVAHLASKQQGLPAALRISHLGITASGQQHLAIAKAALASPEARAALTWVESLILTGDCGEEAQEGELGAALAQLCPGLQSLEQRADESSVSLRSLEALCPGLQRLRFMTEGWLGAATHLSPSSPLCSSLRHLTLTLNDYSRLNLQPLAALKALQELEVGAYDHVHPPVAGIDAVAQGCTSLRSLTVYCMSVASAEVVEEAGGQGQGRASSGPAGDASGGASSGTSSGKGASIGASGSEGANGGKAGSSAPWWPSLEQVQWEEMEVKCMAALQVHRAPRLKKLGRVCPHPDIDGQGPTLHAMLCDSTPAHLATLCTQLANCADPEALCPRTVIFSVICVGRDGPGVGQWGPCFAALAPIGTHVRRVVAHRLLPTKSLEVTAEDVTALAAAVPQLEQLLVDSEWDPLGGSGACKGCMGTGALLAAVTQLPQLQLVKADRLRDRKEAALARQRAEERVCEGSKPLDIQGLLVGVSSSDESDG